MRILPLCAVVVLGVTAPLTAQPPDSLPPRPTLDSLFAEHGRVRVVTADTTLVARQPRVAGDRLRWQESSVAGIAVADIREIQVYSSRFGRGVVIGGAIGGLLGLLGTGVCGDLFTCSTGDIVRGMTFYVVAGALIGGIIGAAKSRWETVYHRGTR